MLLTNTQSLANLPRCTSSLSSGNLHLMQVGFQASILKGDLQNVYSKNLSTGKLSSLGSQQSSANSKMTLASIKMHDKLIKSNLLNTNVIKQPSVIKIQTKKTTKKKNIFGVQANKQTIQAVVKGTEGTILPVLTTPNSKHMSAKQFRQNEMQAKVNDYTTTYGQM